jgi:hypothetical protein
VQGHKNSLDICASSLQPARVEWEIEFRHLRGATYHSPLSPLHSPRN